MKLIAATKNPGKLKEFQRILAPWGIEVVPQQELCPRLEVEETGRTFRENAYLKARAIADTTGLAAIADDSGLCVDALGGKPGVYSARYGGPNATDADRNQKLLAELAGVPQKQRTARFISAICCIFPQTAAGGTEQLLQCEGSCEGLIGFEPKGDGGFGYDPLFFVGEKSFAELSGAEKDALSHRGKALAKLEKELKRLFGENALKKEE